MTFKKNRIPALLLIAVGLLLMALGTRGDRSASWQGAGFFAAVGLAAAAVAIVVRRRQAGQSERSEDGTDDSTK